MKPTRFFVAYDPLCKEVARVRANTQEELATCHKRLEDAVGDSWIYFTRFEYE